MSNKRILYFDALKFFAIWLVVLGHYLQEIDCGSVGSYTNQVIYTFHMPLFIMISGFFAQKFNNQENYNTFITCNNMDSYYSCI